MGEYLTKKIDVIFFLSSNLPNLFRKFFFVQGVKRIFKDPLYKRLNPKFLPLKKLPSECSNFWLYRSFFDFLKYFLNNLPPKAQVIGSIEITIFWQLLCSIGHSEIFIQKNIPFGKINFEFFERLFSKF